MATTFGTRPEDTVADSRGNVQPGVVIQLYPTKTDATNKTALIASPITDSQGLYAYSDSLSRTGLWARDPSGRIWAINCEETGANVDGKADKTYVDSQDALKLAISAADAQVATQVNTGGSATDVALKGKYVRKGDLFYNVRDAAYGAVGDGITDDKAAIQAAIDAANAAGGGTVFIPASSSPYLVKSSLSLKSNVTIVGGGYGSVIKSDMTAAAHVITSNSGATNLHIGNLALDQSTSNTNNRCAIALLSCTGVTIANVLVKRAYYDAVQIIACNDVAVTNVVGLVCGRNGVAVDQTVGTSNDIAISNCVMIADGSSANLNAGFDVEAGRDVTITNCTARGAFVYGCSVLGEISGTYLSQRVHINGLIVNGHTGYGVYVTGVAGAVSDVLIRGLIVGNGTGGEGVRIAGNVTGWEISDFSLLGTSTAAKNGILTITDASGTPGIGRISNGRITGYTSHGISTISQILVSAVYSHGNAGSGVLCTTGSADSVITGCILTANTRYGIESAGTADRLINVGNNLRGNTSGDINLVGSANMLGLYIPKSPLTATPTTIGYLVQAPVAQTLAANGAVTLDASRGDCLVTLQANATSSSIANPTTNQKLTVTWLQDATGGRTYAWPANCKFAGGAAPADTTANKRSSATFIYDGTNWQELARSVAVG